MRDLRPTCARIDLHAFARNIRAVRNRLPEKSRLIAVLKADAYGHGAVPLAKVCMHEGVSTIAVALFEEAVEIRRAGVETRILILGPLTPHQAALALHEAFSLAISGPEALEGLCGVVRETGLTARIELELDSGMGRLGFVPGDLEACAALLTAEPRIHVEAIFTHFASASDPHDTFTNVQIETFTRMVAALRTRGIDAALHHLANSAAIARGLVEPGDSVRAGISLYGAEALDHSGARFEPVMSLHSRISRLKRIGPGDSLGYGRTFIASRESRIATIPIGYADGVSRLLSNRGHALVRGQRVPFAGRVSMDLITLDVTDVHGAATGDEVVLLGSQGSETITVEEIAASIGTIPYEVFCSVSSRVPRVYETGSGQVTSSRFDACLDRRDRP